MKKLKSIKSFVEGEKIQGFFLCTEKHLRHTRNGDIYIDIELRDITGHISGKIWNNISALNEKFVAGNAVAVSGIVELYLEKTQLNVKKINKATIQHYARYGFDPANVVPSSKKNTDRMWKDIESNIRLINDKSLRRLVESIYRSFKKKIIILPGSIKSYYSFRSGFIEHIVSMLKLANKITSAYNINKDMVIAGIFLHDIGKLREINSEYIADYTMEGNLLGSKVLGRDILMENARHIKNLNEIDLLKLEHIILVCGVNTELKSEHIPSFSEALFIKQIKMLDTSMNIMDMVYDEEKENSTFTTRFNDFGIPLFKGNETR